MAVDPLIVAARLLGTLQSKDPPPVRLDLARLSVLAMGDGLAEQQLRVVGVEGEPSA
jgi:hypothetical protein